MSNFKKAAVQNGKKAAPTQTAAQRIENLERTVDGIRKMIQVVAEEMDKLQQTQLALAKRLDATLKVATSGDLSEEKVNAFEIDQQVKAMKDKVELLVSQGALVESDEIKQGNNFIVGHEINKEGEVVSVRTQATISTLPKEVQDALMGKKVGDLISFAEGQASFQVEEIYLIESANQNNQENAGA